MTMRSHLHTLPRLARGCCLVAGAFLVLLAGWGAVYAHAAFAPRIGNATGMAPAAIAVLFAVAAGGGFLLGPLAGRLADRFGPGPLALAGMLASGGGLILASFAEGFIGFALSYGVLVGIGVGLSYGPAMAAVACAFQARRGLASAIAAMGIGVGTMLVPVASNALSALGNWRLELSCLGLGVLVLGLIGAALLGGRPASRPLRLATTPAAAEPSLSAASLRRLPAFRRLWLGTTLVSVPAAMPFAQLVPHAIEAGLDPQDAVALIGLIGLGSIIGRVGLGAAADRFGRQPAYLLCCLGLSLACLGWAGATAASLPAFALVFGIFQGGFVALSSAVVVDLCGRSIAATATGLRHSGRGIAVLVGPPAFAALGAGTLPILLCAGLGLAGASTTPGSAALARGLLTPLSRALAWLNRENSSFPLASTTRRGVLGA